CFYFAITPQSVVSKLILAEEKHEDSLKKKTAFSACDDFQRSLHCPVGEEAHQPPTESVVFFRSDHLCSSLKCYVTVYINYEVGRITAVPVPKLIKKLYTNTLKIKINPSPTTEMTVSSNVQVANVSFIVRPKNSLNIQKPASFTWEAIKLPAPVDNTIRARFTSDPCINGITRPAVVNAATVADP